MILPPSGRYFNLVSLVPFSSQKITFLGFCPLLFLDFLKKFKIKTFTKSFWSVISVPGNHTENHMTYLSKKDIVFFIFRLKDKRAMVIKNAT